MKRFLSLLLAGTLLVTLAICLTGCEGMVTERQMKTMVEQGLEEKYKEKFKCISVLDQNPNGSYNCVCYPTNNEKLKFEARVYTDGKMGVDYYPTSIASAELSDVFDNALGNALGKHFTYAYTAGGPDDDEITQKIADGEFSLEFYLKHHMEVYDDEGNSYYMYFTVCVDTSDLSVSYEEEWEAISNAFNEVYELGLKYCSDIYFSMNLYFTPPDVYKECEKYLSQNAEIRTGFKNKILGKYQTEFNRLIHFAVIASENQFSPTKEEYINLRKEID